MHFGSHAEVFSDVRSNHGNETNRDQPLSFLQWFADRGKGSRPHLHGEHPVPIVFHRIAPPKAE